MKPHIPNDDDAKVVGVKKKQFFSEEEVKQC
jgi:hypothetical protein